VSLIKSKNTWLFFDDDTVDIINEATVAATFGNTQVCAMVTRQSGSGATRRQHRRTCLLSGCSRLAWTHHVLMRSCAAPGGPAAAAAALLLWSILQEFSQHMDHGYILFYERVQ
jgi:hypothetical protein